MFTGDISVLAEFVREGVVSVQIRLSSPFSGQVFSGWLPSV